MLAHLTMIQTPRAYRIGAYAVYPALAAAGGELLSRANSTGAMIAAAALLCAAFVLLALLGRYCRRCGERLPARLLRLFVLPAAIVTALALRSEQRREQYMALGLVGSSLVAFSLAWQMSAPAAPEAKKDSDAG